MSSESRDTGPQGSITRFRTNADLGGVEKISIASVNKDMLDAPYTPLKSLHAGSPTVATAKRCTTQCFVSWMRHCVRRSCGALLHFLCQGMEEVPCATHLLPRAARAGTGAARSLVGEGTVRLQEFLFAHCSSIRIRCVFRPALAQSTAQYRGWRRRSRAYLRTAVP